MDAVDTQLREIGLDGGAQLGGFLRSGDRNGPSDTAPAHLADDDQIVGVWRQSGSDSAVHFAVGVERRGVDVVHAEFDRPAQDRRGLVGRRRLRLELHRAIADAGDLELADAAMTARCHWMRHHAPG